MDTHGILSLFRHSLLGLFVHSLCTVIAESSYGVWRVKVRELRWRSIPVMGAHLLGAVYAASPVLCATPCCSCHPPLGGDVINPVQGDECRRYGAGHGIGKVQ